MIKEHNYEMYTEVGNLTVSVLVEYARENGYDWPETYRLLQELSVVADGAYGECMDTAVRECVYDSLGFETNFYV